MHHIIKVNEKISVEEYHKKISEYQHDKVMLLFDQTDEETNEYIYILSLIVKLKLDCLFVVIDSFECEEICEFHQVTFSPQLLIKSNESIARVTEFDDEVSVETVIKSFFNETAFNSSEMLFEQNETNTFEQVKNILNADKNVVFYDGNNYSKLIEFKNILHTYIPKQSINYVNVMEQASKATFTAEISKLSKNVDDYPLLFVDKQFKLGYSMLKAMNSSEKLADYLDVKIGDRLKTIINMGKVVLFMKGSPFEPKCGFSRTVVTILNEINVEFCHFDILKDYIVREELKKYSKWPTYPQLYCNGELIGGCDIIKQLYAAGELSDALS